MTTAAPLELWGGLECTVRRVGDRFADQIVRTGHHERPEDLDRFAALGLRTLRYPVLWERTAPDGVERADWRWPDARLARLRESGIRPIVTLLHHGSGPRGTDLLDPEFPDRLATYAGAVARRYPWVGAWTPVNEPLTTARFACLYGHWHPHACEEASFVRALVTQCRAVARAMEAIREVNPDARLVQTEDLAKTHATPALAHQAAFENERRWLTTDLLCGRVDPSHPLWNHLRGTGLAEAELTPLLERPCPPDVMGFNHYVTSERFLDERLDRYPVRTHGGNGRELYADVAAVRVLADGPDGPERLLREAWHRYGRPLAITEAHLGGPADERVRWLHELWDAARRVRAAGGDVRAVTAWSLLGAYDWDSLLLRDDGSYEPGVFDVREGGDPVPTPLAELVRDLALLGESRHPALAAPGWWRRPERLLYPPVERADTAPTEAAPREEPPAAPASEA